MKTCGDCAYLSDVYVELFLDTHVTDGVRCNFKYDRVVQHNAEICENFKDQNEEENKDE
jgi:hypothetical protein